MLHIPKLHFLASMLFLGGVFLFTLQGISLLKFHLPSETLPSKLMRETLCRPKFPGRHLIEACNICRSINPAQRRCCKVDKTTHAKVIGWVIPCTLFFVRDYLIDID